MKRLTLVRHAKSSWKDPECADFDRPLTKRGKNDALIMGRLLAERGEYPSLVISSPAKRASVTIKRIVREMGIDECTIVWDQRLYHADAFGMLAVIRETARTHGHVMVCGHNPGLMDFCNLVAGIRIDKLPTCAVVVIDCPLEKWPDLGEASGTARSFDFPRENRLPGRLDGT